MYAMKRKIGTGKFSVVYQGIDKSTGSKCAIKVIESYKLEAEEKNLIAYTNLLIQSLNWHYEIVFSSFACPVQEQYTNQNSSIHHYVAV